MKANATSNLSSMCKKSGEVTRDIEGDDSRVVEG